MTSRYTELERLHRLRESGVDSRADSGHWVRSGPAYAVAHGETEARAALKA